MKKKITMSLAAGLLCVVYVFVLGFAEATIQTTVDPETIGIAVDRTAVAYGVRVLGTSALSGAINVTNTGNISVRLLARGDDSSGPGTERWSLVSGTAALTANQYVHRISPDGSNYFPLVKSFSQHATIAPGVAQAIYLHVTLPPVVGSSFSGRHTMPVMLRAEKL